MKKGEIKIRDVDISNIAIIDSEAAKRGVSRNKMMHIIIENFVLSPKMNTLNEQYKNLVNDLFHVIDKNNQLLERFMEHGQ